jgi:hypothetical protein
MFHVGRDRYDIALDELANGLNDEPLIVGAIRQHGCAPCQRVMVVAAGLQTRRRDVKP